MRVILLLMVLATTALWSALGSAATDTEALTREMKIMAEILRTATQTKDSSTLQLGPVSGHYLAGQGVLFSTSVRSHFVRSGRYGDIDLSDIPQVVNDIMTDVRVSIPYVDTDTIEELRDLREEQRDLRDEQRDLRRRLRDQQRKLDAAGDDGGDGIKRAIEKLEAQLATSEKQSDDLEEQIDTKLAHFREEREDRYKQRRLDLKQAFAALETQLLQTLCDYGATLKSLPSDEHVNLLIANLRGDDNDDFDRVYVFEKKDMMACQQQSIDAAKLRERGTIYDQ